MVMQNPRNFEEALKELESIVRSLEEGKTSLDAAIQAYERGAILRSYCEEQLKSARLRMAQVVVGEKESPTLQPLEDVALS